MSRSKIVQIRKRDGSIVPFQPDKIEGAIYKAFLATGIGGRELAAELGRRITNFCYIFVSSWWAIRNSSRTPV